MKLRLLAVAIVAILCASAFPRRLDNDNLATGTVSTQDIGSTTVTGQNAQPIISGTATALSTLSMTVGQQRTVLYQLSGTWTGTEQFEKSYDGGVTWYPWGCHVVGTAYNASTVTASGLFQGVIGGANVVRVRATAAMTGSCSVKIILAYDTSNFYLQNGNMRLWDGNGNFVNVSGGAIATTAAALPLPTGAALEAGNLATVATNSATTNTKLNGGLPPALVSGGLVTNGLTSLLLSTSEASNTVSTAAALTLSGGGDPTTVYGVWVTNTGTVDAFVATFSGGHTFPVPAGTDRFIPCGTTSLFGLTVSGSTTLYCVKAGH